MTLPTSLKPGDPVDTPRGGGLVASVAGAPGAELVTVDLRSVMVQFRIDEVLPRHLAFQPGDSASVEAFLAPDPAQHLDAVERFLASGDVVRQAPDGGKTLGARSIRCTCECGRAGNCHRLSTAPDVHQPSSTACGCERNKCSCA